MSKGDLKNNIDKNTSVKEDLFEAIIGAVTLDTLWDFDKIQDVVGVMLRPELILDADVTDDNYIKLIQDWESKHYNVFRSFYIKKEVGMRVFVLENNHFIGDMGVQHRRACIIRKLVTHIHMAMSI